MKKLFFYLLALPFILVSISCIQDDGKAKDRSTSNHDEDGNDTLIAEKPKAVEIKTSSDVALFDLKGNVKSVTYSEINVYPFEWTYSTFDPTPNPKTITFTNEGKLITPNVSTASSVKISRDVSDNITSIQVTHLEADESFTFKIKRDSNGRLTGLDKDGVRAKDCWSNKYSYNPDGLISKCDSKGFTLYGDEATWYETYSYDSFDEYGNWTKRTVNTRYGEPTVQTRKIIYHGSPEANYITDLGVFELKGNVKNVTYYDWSCPFTWGSCNNEIQQISFTSEGEAIAPKDIKIVRNDNGYISNFQFHYYNEAAGEYMWGDQHLNCNSDGQIIGQTGEGCEHSWEIFHYYNSDDNIDFSRIEHSSDGDDYTETINYQYLEFDENGNWTKRTFKSTNTYNGAVETGTQTRSIVYY